MSRIVLTGQAVKGYEGPPFLDANEGLVANVPIISDSLLISGNKLLLPYYDSKGVIQVKELTIPTISSGSGSSTFLGLSDTPASFSGQGGKLLGVNSAATDLEFVDAPDGVDLTEIEEKIADLEKKEHLEKLGSSTSLNTFLPDINDSPTVRSGIRLSSRFSGDGAPVSGKGRFQIYCNKYQGELGSYDGGILQHLKFLDGSGYYTRHEETGDGSGSAGSLEPPTAFTGGWDFVEGELTSFLKLSDTPSSFTGQAGKIAQVNSASNAIEFVDKPAGDGSSTFLGLSDTPSAFTSQGGKLLGVNSGATALEFVDKPQGEGGDDERLDAGFVYIPGGAKSLKTIFRQATVTVDSLPENNFFTFNPEDTEFSEWRIIIQKPTSGNTLVSVLIGKFGATKIVGSSTATQPSKVHINKIGGNVHSFDVLSSGRIVGSPGGNSKFSTSGLGLYNLVNAGTIGEG